MKLAISYTGGRPRCDACLESDAESGFPRRYVKYTIANYTPMFHLGTPHTRYIDAIAAQLLESLRQLADPFELMKFTLIYDDDLPAGDNKRVLYASRVRNRLHSQMADLWDSHVIFRQLARTARIRPGAGNDIAVTNSNVSDYRHPIPPMPFGYVDLCAPIEVPTVGKFVPAIRDSLHLNCAIDLLFLRHEEPMHLFRAGGDLDNRIKCFFDGLRMPNQEEGTNGEEPVADPLYCLLEDDRMISDFSVRTGRLLGDRTKSRHAVRIQADVTVKVLRVTDQNQCLIGG